MIRFLVLTLWLISSTQAAVVTPPPCSEIHNPAPPAQRVFSYGCFDAVGGLTLMGNAQQSGDLIMLTQDQVWQQGTAAYDTPLNLSSGSFHMDAVFSIASAGSAADGLVFRFQPNINESGPSGGALGIFGQQGLFVVLDTFQNANYGDLPSPSVAVISCGIGVGADPDHSHGCTVAMAEIGFSVTDGAFHSMSIQDDSGEFRVFVDSSKIVETPLALSRFITDSTYVEVSGVTGGLSQQTDLRSWGLDVVSSPEPVTTVPVGAILVLLLVMFLRSRRRASVATRPTN